MNNNRVIESAKATKPGVSVHLGPRTKWEVELDKEAKRQLQAIEDAAFERGKAEGLKVAAGAAPGAKEPVSAPASVSSSGAPAQAHEREAYATGRRDAATSREYQRGVADEQGADPGARNSRIAASEGSQGGGPFAGQVAREDLDRQSQVAWDSNADLRAEFGSFDRYRAFCRADVAGRARIFSRETVKRYRREDFKGEQPAGGTR